MNQLTTNSSPPPPPVTAPNPSDQLARRKRGRPRKDETSHMSPQPKEDLIGQSVSGVIEGSFDAGYMLNLNVKDSDKKLRGLVFIPGKVTPVTQENDVAPSVKMYERNQIKNPTTGQSLPNNDTDMAESSRALSLIPHESNGEAAKEDMVDKNGAVEDEATRLVEFFPTPTVDQPQPQHKSTGETSRGLELMEVETTKIVMTDQPQPNLVLAQKETEAEKVSEMLQLELGNKVIVNGDNHNSVTIEKEHETSEKVNVEESVTKSGFIANLLDGGEKNGDCGMEEEKEATTTPSVK